ncbi:MAG: hypothetical protein VX589_05080 [Myxococcota bacterium]|nr:hypothetical protein [Myxococcota bacterium]
MITPLQVWHFGTRFAPSVYIIGGAASIMMPICRPQPSSDYVAAAALYTLEKSTVNEENRSSLFQKCRFKVLNRADVCAVTAAGAHPFGTDAGRH